MTATDVAPPPSDPRRRWREHRSPALLPGWLGRHAFTIVAVLGALVVIAALATWHHDAPLHVEQRIDHAIARLGIDVRVYQAGTDLASPFTFSFIVAGLALWSVLRRSWRELAACAAAPLTVLIVQVLLKPGIDRTIGAHHGYSFPSGHAAATTAWVTLAILLVMPIFPDLLSRVVRDAGAITLEQAHYHLSYMPAWVAGFKDRGCIREGMAADLIMYDLEKLAVEEPEMVYDLPPNNDSRLVQRPRGYRWIMVNGEVSFEEGKDTRAYPGRLVRCAA